MPPRVREWEEMGKERGTQKCLSSCCRLELWALRKHEPALLLALLLLSQPNREEDDEWKVTGGCLIGFALSYHKATLRLELQLISFYPIFCLMHLWNPHEYLSKLFILYCLPCSSSILDIKACFFLFSCLSLNTKETNIFSSHSMHEYMSETLLLSWLL